MLFILYIYYVLYYNTFETPFKFRYIASFKLLYNIERVYFSQPGTFPLEITESEEKLEKLDEKWG